MKNKLQLTACKIMFTKIFSKVGIVKIRYAKIYGSFTYIYGPIARKLYHRLFPKSIFQSTSTAQNDLSIVSLYLWLYEKPKRPPKFPFQFLSKLNSTN